MARAHPHIPLSTSAPPLPAAGSDPVAPADVPEPAPHEDSELRQAGAALRRFFTVAAVLAALCAVPYLHESMEDYRYLGQIDASPLLRALTFSSVQQSQAAAVLPGGMPVGGDMDEDIEAGLWHDPALHLSQAQAEARLAAADADPAVSADAALGGAPAVAGNRPKEPGPGAKPGTGTGEPVAAPVGSAALQITAASIGEHKVFFHDPKRSLDPYYAALRDLALGKRDKVRVRHYGDSHIANDGTTHALRVLLQRRFGDGGHGFVLVKARTRWYKHKGIKAVASDGYKVRNFLGGGLPDGAFGYGGVASSGAAGQSFRIETASSGAGQSATRFELFYRSLGPATLQVTADGKRQADIVVKPPIRDLFSLQTFPDGPHKLRVRVKKGMVRFYGVAVERDKGLVYDSLGVVGARASRWGNVNAAHISAQIKHRGTDLLVVNYGGNARDDKVTQQRYSERFVRALSRLRLKADEPCLILGPSDHGKRKGGKIISDPNTLRIAGWQRQIALDQGCAFYDTIGAMGGEGSMGRWVKDGLGWSDYAHLTPKGMRALGQALYAAHLHGLKGYLARTGYGDKAEAPAE